MIGDKKGGGIAKWLATSPEALDVLQKKIGIPIRLIHITRNPFDTITTSLIRRNEKGQRDINEVDLNK